MDQREERIRTRAYEVWERQGRRGNPEDHWLEAERALKAEDGSSEAASDRSDATVEEAPPVAAVEALEAASEAPAKTRRPRRPAKGST